MTKRTGIEAVERAEILAIRASCKLEDDYKTSIKIPKFSATTIGYSGPAKMRYQNNGKKDVIKVRKDMNWSDSELLVSNCHELGHAALYQNSNMKELKEKDEFDDLELGIIREGVAENFERRGYEYLLNDSFEDISSLGYPKALLSRLRKRFDEKILSKAFTDKWIEGRKLLGYEDSEKIKYVIDNLEEFYTEAFEEGVVNRTTKHKSSKPESVTPP